MEGMPAVRRASVLVVAMVLSIALSATLAYAQGTLAGSITITPASSSISAGQQDNIAVSGHVLNGTAPFTYQWLAENPGANSYVPISSDNGNVSISATSSSQLGTYNIKFIVTDANGDQLVSNVASVTIVGSSTSSANVTVSPSSSSLKIGSSVTLSASGPPTTGGWNLQWYVLPPGSSTYQPISGATSTSFVVIASSSYVGSGVTYYSQVGTYDFEIIASKGTTSVTSGPSVITIVSTVQTPLTGSIIATPQAASIVQGNSDIVDVTGTIAGGQPPYTTAWYVENPGNTTWQFLSNINGNLPFTTSTATRTGIYNFQFRVSDSTGSNDTSNIASVDVVASSGGTGINESNPFQGSMSVTPVGTSVGQGSSVVLNGYEFVSGGTKPYTFAWYYQPPGSTSLELAPNQNGGSTYTFTTSPFTPTGSYIFEYRAYDANLAEVDSNEGFVTVTTPTGSGTGPFVQITPQSSIITGGSPVYFNAQLSNDNAGATHYQWYENGQSIAGETDGSYTFWSSASAPGTYTFRVAVTDGSDRIFNSTNVTVVVQQSPGSSGATLSGNIDVYSGKNVDTSGNIEYLSYVTLGQGGTQTLTANDTISGGTPPLSFQWYIEGPNDYAFRPISGANNAYSYQFVTNSNTQPGVYKFQLIATDANDNQVSSSVSFVNVVGTSSGGGTTTTIPQSGQSNMAGQITIATTQSSVEYGGSSVLTVGGELSGGVSPYTYEWYIQNPGSGTWQTYASGNGNLTFTPTSSQVGVYSFEFVVTDETGKSIVSNIVSINVLAGPGSQTTTSTISSSPNSTTISNSGPQQMTGSITITPASGTVVVGGPNDKIAVTGSISGGTAPYTFEWYIKNPGSSNWATLSSLNGNITIGAQPGTAPGSYGLQFTVSDSSGHTIVSNQATVQIVSSGSSSGGTSTQTGSNSNNQANAANRCSGGSVTASSTSSTLSVGQSATLSEFTTINFYNCSTEGWYVENPQTGSYQQISPGASDYTVYATGGAGPGTYNYEFIVYNASGQVAASSPIPVTIVGPPGTGSSSGQATISASASEVASGSSVTLSASGYVSGSTYQWQVMPPDGSWEDIPGATTQAYTFLAGYGPFATFGTYEFQLVVTPSSGGSYTTSPISVSVE